VSHFWGTLQFVFLQRVAQFGPLPLKEKHANRGGDDQGMRTMQTLLNVVEFGTNIQQAIEAPRWTTRSFPSSPFPHTVLRLRLAEVRTTLAQRSG
jgi:hypothetical protein